MCNLKKGRKYRGKKLGQIWNSLRSILQGRGSPVLSTDLDTYLVYFFILENLHRYKAVLQVVKNWKIWNSLHSILQGRGSPALSTDLDAYLVYITNSIYH